MNRTKKIAILAIVAMVLSMIPVQLFGITDTTRIYGATRVETALAVADEGWTSADTVIVAPADQANLVDALAASSLAGQENAPILLTFKDSLSSDVKAKITALGAKKVYVVGAITDSVKNEIAAISGVSVEVLKGTDRWGTAGAINAKLTGAAGTFVVGYAALPDALSVGSYAAANGYAIVLADVNGNVPAGQSTLGSTTYVIGGPTLTKDISGATRLYGQDRYETNAKIIEALEYTLDRVYVANGNNDHLVDSLVVAPLAAMSKAPVALTDGSDVKAASVITPNVTDATIAVALGGPSVVSDNVRLKAIGQGTSDTDPGSGGLKVDSIEILNAKQFKVVFGKAVDQASAEKVSNYSILGDGLTNYKMTGMQDENDKTAEKTDKAEAHLQSDGRTVIVTVDADASAGEDDYQFTNNEEYDITINGVKDTAGSAFPKTTESVLFKSNSVPSLKSVEVLGPRVVKLYFSEPMDVASDDFSSTRDILINGGSIGIDSSNVTSDPVNCAVDVVLNSVMEDGKTYTLRVKNLPNYVGYAVPQSDMDFSVTYSTTAPTFTISSAEPDKIVVVFSDYVKNVDNTNNEIKIGSTVLDLDKDLDNGGATVTAKNAVKVGGVEYAKKWEIELGEKSYLNGDTVTVTINNIASSSSNQILDMWGNKFVSSSQKADVYTDTSTPEVLEVRVESSNELVVVFSKDMDDSDVKTYTNYTFYTGEGKIYELSGVTSGSGYMSGNFDIDYDSDAYEATLTLAGDLEEGDYQLRVSGIYESSKYSNQKISTTNLEFSIDSSGSFALVSAVMTDKDDLILTFNRDVYTSSTESAKYYKNPSNYEVAGTNLSSKTVSVKLIDNRTVQLTSTWFSQDKHLGKEVVADIADKDGNRGKATARTATIFEPQTKLIDLVKSLTVTDVDVAANKVKVVLETNYRIDSLSSDFKKQIEIYGQAPSNFDIINSNRTQIELTFNSLLFDTYLLNGEFVVYDEGVPANSTGTKGYGAEALNIGSTSAITFRSGHELTLTNGGTVQSGDLDSSNNAFTLKDEAAPRVKTIYLDFNRSDNSKTLNKVQIVYSEALSSVTSISGSPFITLKIGSKTYEASGATSGIDTSRRSEGIVTVNMKENALTASGLSFSDISKITIGGTVKDVHTSSSTTGIEYKEGKFGGKTEFLTVEKTFAEKAQDLIAAKVADGTSTAITVSLDDTAVTNIGVILTAVQQKVVDAVATDSAIDAEVSYITVGWANAASATTAVGQYNYNFTVVVIDKASKTSTATITVPVTIVDTTPPALVANPVTISADGKTITVTFNKNIDRVSSLSSLQAAVTVLADSSSAPSTTATVDSVTIDGAKLIVKLVNSLTSGDYVTVNITGNELQDTAGHAEVNPITTTAIKFQP